MNKKVVLVAFFMLCVCFTFGFAQEEVTEDVAPQTEEATITNATSAPSGWAAFAKPLTACIAVSVACISGGIAVGQIGSAAMGAMAENAEVSGKAIPFVGLAEGICLWGFLVALLILIL